MIVGIGSGCSLKGTDRLDARARPIGGLARTLFLLALILTAAGCISEEREQEIGDTMAGDVNPHLPLIRDPLLNAYLHSVGGQIGQVSARPDLEYRFYIIDTDVVNAFALPGGHIYVTRGLIRSTQTGEQFAGVLAHEIGHVAARHGVAKLQRHLRTGSLVNVLYNMILGGEPALLRDNSLYMADQVWSARHSRRDEKEADRLAVKYLLRSGVDPHAVIDVLEALHEEEQAQDDATGAWSNTAWFSTHPLTANRIRETRAHIEKLGPQTPQVLTLDLDGFDMFRMLVSRSGFHPPAILGH
jgi:beta-barrel assembly-enhancing protease